jgi:hypothetical protein
MDACAFCGKIKKEAFRTFIGNGGVGADFVPLTLIGGDYCIDCLSKMWDRATQILDNMEW